MTLIPGLGSIHIPYDDAKGDTCLSKALRILSIYGIKAGVRSYIDCIVGHVKLYIPVIYINSIQMFKHAKDEKEKATKPISSWKQIALLKKQQRMQRKQAKLEMKKAKLSAEPKKEKVKKVKAEKKSVMKHITALPFVGSKMLTGFSGFLAAAAFYQFEVPVDYKLAGILAGATLVTSVLGAAPYMQSVSRTNNTLATVVGEMDRIDSAVGSQQQLVSQVVASMESLMQQKGIAPDIQSVKAQLASMNKSFDDLKEALKNSGMEVRSSPQKEVHTAPNNTVNTPKGKNNVVVD